MHEKTISVAIIDSYHFVRCAFTHQLRHLGLSVAIEVGDIANFLLHAAHTPIPDICILDIDTKSIQEFTAALQLKALYPVIKIMAYTVHEQEYTEVKQYGIDIFLPKTATPEEMKAHIVALAEE